VSFATLALIGSIALLGPLLALPEHWHLPVLIGELAAGVAFGETGLRVLHARNGTFTFLADIGFGLIMYVAGSKVPVRDPRLRSQLKIGALRAVGIGAVAVAVGIALAALFNTGHAALYAVLIASSSAALVLPIVDSLHLDGPSVLALLAQVAIADTACIVALPLAIETKQAGRAALGVAAVVACSAVVFLALRYFEASGVRKRLHRMSERRKFALELRANLIVLFALAALATTTHISIMLAGFSLGLATSAVGEPRRLAKQLFAISDGFFGPLFFVWLGASLDLRELGHHPSFIGLGVALGAAAVLAHLGAWITRQPLPLGLMAGAQLGVPVAAATIGTQDGLLHPGEASALLLGALITVAIATLGGSLSARTRTVQGGETPAG
jgi:Kef-type K+ transport system membrane component KefB